LLLLKISQYFHSHAHNTPPKIYFYFDILQLQLQFYSYICKYAESLALHKRHFGVSIRKPLQKFLTSILRKNPPRFLVTSS
jgi:hypothetical protein